MTRFQLLAIATTLTGLLGLSPAVGDDAAETPPPMDFQKRQGVGVGMAVSYSDEPYRGMGSDVQPFPILLYRGKRFAAFGPFLSYQLFGLDRPWAVKAVLSPSFDGYDSDDSNFLEGMDDRDMTAEGGLEVELETDLAEVGLAWKHDLLDEHDGYSIDLTLRKPLFFGRVLVAPSVSYVYDSDNRSDYYFGVRPDEATPDRPAYELDGTHNWQAGVLATTNLTRKVFAMAGADYTLFDDDIQDSPIVNQDGQYRIFVGFGYMFGGEKPAERAESMQALLNR
jgi:outer membrane protein